MPTSSKADELSRCPGCKRAWTSCRCDKAAEQWLREHAAGERLPDEIDSGRFCGDRSPSLEDRRRVGESPELVMRLREYADRLRARRAALQLEQTARDQERRQLLLHLDILEHWVCAGEPEGVKALGHRHGHGHSWAVEQRERVIAAAYRLGARGHLGVVAVSCACGCGGVVTHWTGNGRPPSYIDDTHRRRAKERRRRERQARARRRRTPPETPARNPDERDYAQPA